MTGKTNVSVLHSWNAEGDEAAREILASLGDVSGIEVNGSQLMVAVYVRPKTTKGGIITVESAQKEDFYQGKVGLIVKLGPQAHHDPDGKLKGMFNGRLPQIGDWVFMDVKSVWQMSVKGKDAKRTRDWDGWPVRLVYPADILGRITSPDMIGGVV